MYKRTINWLARNREPITYIASAVAAVFALLTLMLCFRAASSKQADLTPQLARAAVLWAILPPFWFWFEYFGMYKPEIEGSTLDASGRQESLNLFKHGQQLAGAMWIGLVGALIATLKYVSEH
jgi:hypothetical protein